MRRHKSGFTLVETLAAMLFMAIVIPVAIEGMLAASRMGSQAQGMRQAALLADQKLTELVATETWRSGDQEGEFEDWPGYRWVMTSNAWSEDTMRLVTVQVFYTVRGQERFEQLSTLADETEPEPETEEEETS